MKITRLETIPINVPLKPDLTTKTAHGEHVVSPYVIVRIHTDTGLVGLGEATLSPRWSGETSPGCVAVIDGLIAPLLVGRDPTQIDSLRPKIEGCIHSNPFTKAAVEMALWDLAGKAAGLPIFQLLGGSQSDEIPIKMVVGAFEIPQATALAKRFLDEGVNCLKVKVGLDSQKDIERVRAIRELAGPQIPIGVDANGGWNLSTARKMIDSLAEFNLLFVEQPISPGDPIAMADLRSGSPIPIMADESIFTLNDAQGLARHSAVDILSCYPGKHGGIAATLEIAQVARDAGIVCSVGSNLELGIATAAMLHVAAACSTFDNQTYPADLIGPLYHQADMLVEPLCLGPATAKVPSGPGLGVELDEDQLQKYRDHSKTAKQLGEPGNKIMESSESSLIQRSKNNPPDQYRTVVKRPDDFDAFWEDVLEQAAQIPLNANMELVPLRCTPEMDVYLVHYDSLDNVRIAGWYCLPHERSGKLPAIVHMPGYISEPPIPYESAQKGYASFGTITRGKLRSNRQFNPGFPGLLTHNIVDRNSYSYRGLYLDASRVIDFLLSRDEIDPTRIGVTGGSQGGGLTISTAALRPEVRAVAASAPFMCGFMDSIELIHTYPYQEIRDYLRVYPDRKAIVEETLAYFDGINFAPRITCPIIVNLGLQDNVCPAETAFAAFDAIASQDKHIYPYDGHGHEAGLVKHRAIVDEFFKTHLEQ